MRGGCSLITLWIYWLGDSRHEQMALLVEHGSPTRQHNSVHQFNQSIKLTVHQSTPASSRSHCPCFLLLFPCREETGLFLCAAALVNSERRARRFEEKQALQMQNRFVRKFHFHFPSCVHWIDSGLESKVKRLTGFEEACLCALDHKGNSRFGSQFISWNHSEYKGTSVAVQAQVVLISCYSCLTSKKTLR